MRRPSVSLILLFGALTVVVVLLAVVFEDRPSALGKPSGKELVARVRQEKAAKEVQTAVRVSPRVPGVERPVAEKLGAGVLSLSNELAQAKLEAADDKLIDEVIQGLISAIDEAAHTKNFARVMALLDMIREAKITAGGRGGGGSNRVTSLKKKILEALGVLGPDGAERALDFVGDANPEVAQSAQDLFFKAIRDPSLGDYKLADLIVAAASELNDAYSASRLYQNIQVRMRPTVGAKTLLQLADVGTDAVKAALPENIAAFVIDASVDSPEKLRAIMDEIVDPTDTRAFEPIYMNGQGKK